MDRRQFAGTLATLALSPRLDLGDRGPSLPPSNPDAELSDEALGWLAHLHRKVSLGGTWHKNDAVGPQWDTTSFAPTMHYARYEPTWLSWSMGLMAETTPAWREEYARILGFVSDRLLEYWSMYEWVEHRGDDPKRSEYPEAMKRIVPKGWFGRYNLPGWAGNGAQGTEYDADPIGAGGRFGLMYKGYMNLVMSMYAYVADDGKYERPFTVKYDDRQQWRYTQRQLNALIADQWQAHEEGIACEVAKVYPWCNTLSGAGVLLYDRLRGSRFADGYFRWQRYYQSHYVGNSAKGPEWLVGYYDPINNIDIRDAGDLNGGNWFATAWHGVGVDPSLFEPLARTGLEALYRPQPGGSAYFSASGAGNADIKVVTGLGAAIAKEIGDETRYRAARGWIMEQYQPIWDTARGEFAFGFGFNEPWPRGQYNAWVMPALLVQHPGHWRRIFHAPNTAKFREPTVEGVDFPTVRVRRARYDAARRTLDIGLTTMDKTNRGKPTSFRVGRLPRGARVMVVVDGAPGVERQAADGGIPVDTTVGDHRIAVRLG